MKLEFWGSPGQKFKLGPEIWDLVVQLLCAARPGWATLHFCREVRHGGCGASGSDWVAPE